MTIICYCDGAARPNPGKGGIGIAIRSKDDKWHYDISESCAKSRITNNEAEYLAVERALIELIRNKLTSEEIIMHSDSEMLVSQLSDSNKKVIGGSYVYVYNRVKKELLPKFSNIKFEWFYRENNAEANLLASKAL